MENVFGSIRSVWKVLIQVLEGFREIRNSEYFKTSTYFPKNWEKTCAQIFFACIVPQTLLGITPGLIRNGVHVTLMTRVHVKSCSFY